MERRINMGDFIAFYEDIDSGMEYLEHHQILGAKWGKLNGPPYPLGSGDHSSAEKKAAASAGIKVGSDSGKGSIENVKKKKSKSGVQNKPKKELTPEEKREKALAAARAGDKKKIAKYIDELSTDELRDAQARSQMKDALTKKDPSEQKASKEELAKQEAIRSGDKEKVKEYATQMTTQELRDAMDKIDLNAKLNHVDPPKTAMDKLSDFANSVDRFRDAAEKGIKAYNVAAKVYNATHKDGPQWPVIENQQQSKEQKKEADVLDKLTKQATKDVAKGVQETKEAQQKPNKKEEKYEKQAEEKLKRDKIDAENAIKLEMYKKELQDKYNPEKAPEVKSVNFDTPVKKDFEDKNIWNSVEDASANSKSISDDLTPAEEAYLRSFMKEGR